MDWSPPDGFERLPSALDGIDVFGPVAAGEAAPDGPVEVRCPQCGAHARFDVAQQAVACRFCGWTDATRAAAPTAVADGEFTHEALAAGAQGFGVDRKELSCASCGAVLAIDGGALTATCPFCASPQVNVREHATVQGLRPTALLPFTTRPEEARKAASTWLGKGWLHPGDLASIASVGGLTGIYLPYWAFSADVDSSWSAEVGTTRTESYYDHESKSWKTRTVIEWEWRNGRVQQRVPGMLVPGTSRLSRLLLDRLEGRFDLAQLVDYRAELLSGWQAQTYDVALPEAWETGRHRMRESARAACMADTGSSHVRSFSMTADLGDEAWRHVLLPVYVAAYRYGDRSYAVLVDGRTGEVSGQKPVAWWKVYLVWALLLSPGLLTGLVGIPLLLLGIGALVLVFALVLLIAGIAGSVWVHQQATAAEAA